MQQQAGISPVRSVTARYHRAIPDAFSIEVTPVRSGQTLTSMTARAADGDGLCADASGIFGSTSTCRLSTASSAGEYEKATRSAAEGGSRKTIVTAAPPVIWPVPHTMSAERRPDNRQLREAVGSVVLARQEWESGARPWVGVYTPGPIRPTGLRSPAQAPTRTTAMVHRCRPGDSNVPSLLLRLDREWMDPGFHTTAASEGSRATRALAKLALLRDRHHRGPSLVQPS
jgi:hypothetical protein